MADDVVDGEPAEPAPDEAPPAPMSTEESVQQDILAAMHQADAPDAGGDVEEEAPEEGEASE
jgi:hypothetical protein